MNYREASRSGIELWKPVLACEDRYSVSNLGNIRSKKQNLNPWINRSGYGVVGFWNRAKQKMETKLVHAVVLTAFDGPKRLGQVCRHLDGNPGNNALYNLCWGTDKDNHLDAKLHGTHKPPPRLVQAGELNHSVKLSLDQVRRIRQRQESAKALASELGVTQWTIFDIRKGRSWAEGTGV